MAARGLARLAEARRLSDGPAPRRARGARRARARCAGALFERAGGGAGGRGGAGPEGDFAELAELGGMTRPGVRLASGTRGRGMFATKDFRSQPSVEESGYVGVSPPPPFVSVPLSRALAVAEDSSAEDEAAARRIRASMYKACGAAPGAKLESFFAAGDVVPHDARLGLMLLFATKRGDAYWRSYARTTVPALADAVPLLAWSEAELAMLGEPKLVEEGRHYRQRAATTAAEWRKSFNVLALGMPPPSDEEAMWALAASSSRTFSTWRAAKDWPELAVMCPALDLANHDVAPNATWDFDEGAGAMSLVACRFRDAEQAQLPDGLWAAAGDEVCISYSPEAGNEKLITHYGFANDANPNDRLAPSDLAHAGVGELLAKLDGASFLDAAGIDAEDLEWIVGDTEVRPAADRRRLCAAASIAGGARRTRAEGEATTREGLAEQARAATDAAAAMAARADGFAAAPDAAAVRAAAAPRRAAAAGYRRQRELMLRGAAELCEGYARSCAQRAEELAAAAAA